MLDQTTESFFKLPDISVKSLDVNLAAKAEDALMLGKNVPGTSGPASEIELLVSAVAAYVARLIGLEGTIHLEMSLDLNHGNMLDRQRVELGPINLAMPFQKSVHLIVNQLRLREDVGVWISDIDSLEWSQLRCRWFRENCESEWIAVDIKNTGHGNLSRFSRVEEQRKIGIEVSEQFQEIFRTQWLEDSFRNFLRGVEQSPESMIAKMPMLGAGREKQDILEIFSHFESCPEISGPSNREETLVNLFTDTVRRYPLNTAVECGSESLTYEELDHRSNLVARRLTRMAVGPGSLVGLLVNRSCDAYVAMIGILKSGGAYVPMDPDYPEDRLEYILKDSGAAVLVTHQSLLHRLKSIPCKALVLDSMEWTHSAESLAPESTPANLSRTDLAYVIYTSGSTGRPKGVMIEHRSICHLIRAEARVFAVTEKDRVYQGFSLAFDASLEEIWLAFFSGGALVAATAEEAFASSELCSLLNKKQVSIFSTVPTVLSFMENDLDSVRTLILGGEAASRNLVDKWKTPHRRVVNTYGPTEATVVATYAECEADQRITIGKGLANLSTFILNDDLDLVPTGTVGELYLGGPCLARGYLGQPELTKEKFISNPFGRQTDPENRLYRTGDLARFTARGEIEFIGRKDAQVKLRGFRIELSEIESVLLACPNVCASAASLHRNPLGLDQLVAYVVCTNGEVFDRAQIFEILRARLAKYMVPSHIEQLESLPMLASGKLDRKNLPAPQNSQAEDDFIEKTSPPRLSFIDPDVQSIYEIWQRFFFPRPVTGIDDDFFALGGHSLLAAKMISIIRKEPACSRLSVVDVYKFPKLGLLANRLREIKEQEVIRIKNQSESSGRLTGAMTVAMVVSAKTKALCYFGQALALIFLAAITTIPLVAVVAYSYRQYLAGANLIHISLTVSAFAFLAMPIYLGFAILAKWVVIGKYKAGTYPVWGSYYFRFWLVGKIEGLIPLSTFHGTVFLNLYYRWMGAKIGKNVFLGTQYLRIYDLTEIGDDSSVEYEAQLFGYTLQENQLVIGPIKLGARTHLGTKSTVSPSCTLMDSAELAAMSLLLEGQTIPENARWTGAPALPLKMNAALSAGNETQMERAGNRQKIFLAVGQLLMIVGLPILIILPGVWLLKVYLQFSQNFGPLVTLLMSPVFSAAGIFEFCLEVALIKWLLIGKIRPANFSIHSFYYLRKWTVESMMQAHLKLCYSLYATLYLVPWFRLMGAKIGRRVEISTVAHIAADLLTIEDESFIADSACLGAPRVRNGRMYNNETYIGRRTFVGNSALVPDGVTLGSGCLVGVLSVPPLSEVERRMDGQSWLGSPAIRLPRRQEAPKFDGRSTYSPAPHLYLQRLFVEFFRITMPATLGFLSLLLTRVSFFHLEAKISVGLLWSLVPFIGIMSALFTVAIAIAGKWILIGKYRPGQYPLWSSFVWRNELVTALHEAFAVPILVNALQGTPFISIYFRLLGCKIGKSAVIETTHFTEFDLISIGDRACLNSHSTIQTHLFEDRVFKQSNLSIGNDCSVGAMAVVLMDSKMNDHSHIQGLSLLMKGESLPEHTRWAGIPVHRVETPFVEGSR